MKSVQRSNLEDKFIDTPDKMEKGREIELEKDKLDEMWQARQKFCCVSWKSIQ